MLGTRGYATEPFVSLTIHPFVLVGEGVRWSTRVLPISSPCRARRPTILSAKLSGHFSPCGTPPQYAAYNDVIIDGGTGVHRCN